MERILFLLRLPHEFQTPLHAGHSLVIILGHGLVMNAGIDQGGVKFLVPQELLNAGDTAARVEQLRGAGMAQAMGVDWYVDPLPTGLQPPVDEVFGQSLIAVKENVVGGTRTAHR